MELAGQVYHDRLRLLRKLLTLKRPHVPKFMAIEKKNHLFCPVQTYNLHKNAYKIVFRYGDLQIVDMAAILLSICHIIYI